MSYVKCGDCDCATDSHSASHVQGALWCHLCGLWCDGGTEAQDVAVSVIVAHLNRERDSALSAVS